MSKVKNMFLVFLFALFLFQIVCAISISNSVFAEDIIYGDVNGDGDINSIDYGIIKQYLLGIINEFDNPNATKSADVDGNEEINSIDAALIKKYILGIIKVFPVYDKSTPAPTITATPTPTTSTPSEFTKLKPSISDVRMSELNRNSIELLWDEVEGAVLYELFRDDVSIGTTSDTYFADINVIEGMNHIYKIRAVNDLGESSQDSSNIMVNTMDAVIDTGTILLEDRYYINLNLEGGATLDLNGYTLNVKGDFVQFEGNVNINSGALKVDGNYAICEEGLLHMSSETDYVFVGEDFTIKGNNYGMEETMTAGQIEVRGNLNCEGFIAGGNHRVILSGEGEQVVSSYVAFNELEIRNEYGVRFEEAVYIKKMQGEYKVIGEMVIVGDIEIEGDVTIEGDLRFIDGYIDLYGHSLNVRGNFVQTTEGPITHIKINGGSLKVDGNYSIYWNSNEAILEMTNENDYVYVGGNFTVRNDNYYYDENIMTAGQIEVRGNLNCEGFIAGGNHRVILSGEGEQVVSSYVAFNELEIRNEYGVRFEEAVYIKKMQGEYKVIGEMVIVGDIEIEGDVTIEGDLRFIDGYIDLYGHSLNVRGNFVQTTEGPITHIKINGGSLKVDGNYSIYWNSNEAILEMTNENDYVYVGGNFTMASNVDHSEYLTAGALEVKGNFTQSNGPLNFAASGTHRTILSGDSVQTITFEYPGTSSFNILKLTKPINTGYIFNTSPVWKSLEE